jgi:protein-S-isoprenylcysteine O-methyltransferase Ste14
MITLAAGCQVISAVRADLRDVVAPTITDPTAQLTLQMIDFVLGQLEASADDQGAWMREEIADIEALADEVVAALPDVASVPQALDALRAGRAPSERLSELRDEYKLASEVLSVVLEALVATPGPQRDRALAVLGAPAVLGILNAREPDAQLGRLALVGLVVFGVGLYFESIADGQLQAFMEDKPHNQGPAGRSRYLNTGVWRHSRHPNYFGTTTVWWGIWLVAMSADPGLWWTAVGPVINTLMLTVLTGSRMTDKIMGSRPEYQKIMRRTRFFFPIPVTKERKAAEQPVDQQI